VNLSIAEKKANVPISKTPYIIKVISPCSSSLDNLTIEFFFEESPLYCNNGFSIDSKYFVSILHTDTLLHHLAIK